MHALSDEALDAALRAFLAEDTGRLDVTTAATVPASARARGELVAKSDCVASGLPVARRVFELLEPDLTWKDEVAAGTRVGRGAVLARLEGRARPILTAERVALNLVQRMSGIAMTTRRFVDALAGTGCRVLDTRKTAPGLRALDKYAVLCGGGENHRIGLYDMFLVKNNHIDRAGSIEEAVARIRRRGLSQKIMVEVRSMAELDQALALAPDFILLDNMSVGDMRAAVEHAAGRVPLEASGGITLENVRAIAETGVDRISIGAITHSVKALDISMQIEPVAPRLP